MSIIPRKFSTDVDENKRLFRQKLLEVVGSLEGFEPEVYSDGIEVPTIGCGYALFLKHLFMKLKNGINGAKKGVL